MEKDALIVSLENQLRNLTKLKKIWTSTLQTLQCGDINLKLILQMSSYNRFYVCLILKKWWIYIQLFCIMQKLWYIFREGIRIYVTWYDFTFDYVAITFNFLKIMSYLQEKIWKTKNLVYEVARRKSKLLSEKGPDIVKRY